MNSQLKWKEPNWDDDNAFSRFISMIYKESVSENQHDKSDFSVHAPHPSLQLQPMNILTNNSALANSSNVSNGYGQPTQNHKSSHNSSSMTQSDKPTSSWMANRGDVENFHRSNDPIFTSSGGVIHVSLRHGVRVDITVDNSIRLTSCAGQIVISISNTGKSSAVKHTNGLVHQVDKFVQIVANEQSKNKEFARYANMSANGITFTCDTLGEVFLLDSIGTRQTKKHFAKLTDNNTSNVFLSKSKHGPAHIDEAWKLIRKASIKKCSENGSDVITINDYRIWQMKDGLVTVARMSFPLKIRASPMNCSFTLSTSHIHCTASSKESAHLFVRCQDQSMHYDGKNFVVRYNGNSAGFDKNDFLIVY